MDKEGFGSDDWAQECWNLTAHLPGSHAHSLTSPRMHWINRYVGEGSSYICVTWRLLLGRHNLECNVHVYWP